MSYYTDAIINCVAYEGTAFPMLLNIAAIYFT